MKKIRRIPIVSFSFAVAVNYLTSLMMHTLCGYDKMMQRNVIKEAKTNDRTHKVSHVRKIRGCIYLEIHKEFQGRLQHRRCS